MLCFTLHHTALLCGWSSHARTGQGAMKPVLIQALRYRGCELHINFACPVRTAEDTTGHAPPVFTALLPCQGPSERSPRHSSPCMHVIIPDIGITIPQSNQNGEKLAPSQLLLKLPLIVRPVLSRVSLEAYSNIHGELSAFEAFYRDVRLVSLDPTPSILPEMVSSGLEAKIGCYRIEHTWLQNRRRISLRRRIRILTSRNRSAS